MFSHILRVANKVAYEIARVGFRYRKMGVFIKLWSQCIQRCQILDNSIYAYNFPNSSYIFLRLFFSSNEKILNLKYFPKFFLLKIINVSGGNSSYVGFTQSKELLFFFLYIFCTTILKLLPNKCFVFVYHKRNKNRYSRCGRTKIIHGTILLEDVKIISRK
jgi:hypothetical protein